MAIAKFQMPDGRVARFEVPDGMNPEEMEAEIMASMPQEEGVPLATAQGALPELGRVAGKAVKEGVFALPNLTQQIAAMVPGAPSPEEEAARPSMGDFVPLQDRIGALIKGFTEPETQAGKIAGNVGAAAIGGITGAGALRQVAGSASPIGQMARVGAASGAGAEATGAMFPDSQLARIGGGLVGGAGYGLTEGSIRNLLNAFQGIGKRQQLAGSLMEGVDEKQLAEAIALQKAAATEHGVKLTGGQVLPKSNIPAFETMATQFKQGASLAKQFREQPTQVRAATEAARSKLPGTVRPLPEMASKGQEAATKTIQGAKNWRSGLVRDDYKGQIPVEKSLEIQQHLATRLRELPQNTDKAELIAQLQSSLTKQVGTERMPVVGTQEIMEQIRQVSKNAASPSLSAKQYSQEARNELQKVIKEVKGIVAQAKPSFGKAERTFRRASEKVVNPLREEVVGKMAGATGYLPGKPAGAQALMTALDKGTAAGSKSAILTTQRQLARFGGDEGKAAYNDTVKTWIANKLDNALEFEGGVPSAKIAENINNAFFKNEAQRQGLKDALAGVAKNTGEKPEVLVKGMENYLHTMAAASKVPAKIGPNRAAINEEINTMLGKLNAITAFTPVRMPARMVNEYFKRDAVGHIAKLLETPEGLQTLRTLANAQPGSTKAYAAAAAFSSVLVQTQLANEPKQEK